MDPPQKLKNANNKLRRTASFSNIQIQEATNEEEEEDEMEEKKSGQ